AAIGAAVTCKVTPLPLVPLYALAERAQLVLVILFTATVLSLPGGGALARGAGHGGGGRFRLHRYLWRNQRSGRASRPGSGVWIVAARQPSVRGQVQGGPRRLHRREHAAGRLPRARAPLRRPPCGLWRHSQDEHVGSVGRGLRDAN